MTSIGTPERLLQRRFSGPYVTSYAQNAEDVRLWRLFSDKTDGFYVDVGAGDPMLHSVTKLFYDAGWSGINVEPGPTFERLDSSRLRDVNLRLAIASTAGEAEMWFSFPDAGLSSLIRPADELLPEGFTTTSELVQTSRLDDVIRAHAESRNVDFLKVDVEGAERAVLESFDAAQIRPTVVVVESIAPLHFRDTHLEWESLLLDRGYLAAAFDGINRFYVAEEHETLAPVLAYPVSVLDRFVLHDSQWRRDSSAPRPEDARRPRLPDERTRRIERDADETRRRLEAVERTLSWRITRPLRAARRMERRRSDSVPHEAASTVSEHMENRALEPTGQACSDRVLQIVSLLDVRVPCATDGQPSTSLDNAFLRLKDVLVARACSAETAAWLALVAVDGRYPGEETVAALARLLRVFGADAAVDLLHDRASESFRSGLAPTCRLDVVADGVVVPVEAMLTTDLHTGIQRVARESISRWLAERPDLRLARFDSEKSALLLLAESERERVRRWRHHLSDSGSPIAMRQPEAATGNPLVPWNCRLVVTELLLDRDHSRALGTLATTGLLDSLSFICFDLIPIVSPETVYEGLTEQYCDYLSAVKRADRVSAISHQSGRDFTAYASILAGEGLEGPRVGSHPLPTVAPGLSDAELAGGLASLELSGLPLVLVVGVHVPRKNHLAILEGADHLWSEGSTFELLFIGGMDQSWGRQFDRYAEDLRTRGWPIRVRRRASEAELWAAYRAARFTVYPSLVEGFGLPVAESLVSGTPVITSNYGAMAEVARDGGALLVDPRNVDELEEQMRRLLTDDELLERLRQEARACDFGSWDRYAEDVWNFLVGYERDSAA